MRTAWRPHDPSGVRTRSVRRGGLQLAGALALLAIAACVQTQAQRFGLPASASSREIAEAERLSLRALDRWIEHETRLQGVSQRLRVAARDLCPGSLGPVLGLVVSGRGVVPRPHRAAAQLRFPDSRVRVVGVLPELAAEQAGVQEGDVLLAVGAWSVDSEQQVYRARRSRETSIELVVLRGDRELTLTAANVDGCAYPAALEIAERVNASARLGEDTTQFNTALLRQVESDAQLALVVGHEIGHLIVDSQGTPGRTGREIEAQADYLGAYLVARAGYPIDERDTSLYDVFFVGSLDRLDYRSRTHPITAARAAAFRETLAEIDQKRRDGAPLLPSAR